MGEHMEAALRQQTITYLKAAAPKIDDALAVIDEAWRQILGRLIAKGRMPYLILDPWSLREIHLETTLGLIFRDFASSMGEGRYLELAESHKKEAALASPTASAEKLQSRSSI